MERWYSPLGRNFTPEAEAVADLALRTPVTAGRVTLQAQVFGHPRVWAATLDSTGGSVSGFYKLTRPDLAAQAVFLGGLAAMLGLPGVPYIALTKAGTPDAKHDRIDALARDGTGTGIFSPQVFRQTKNQGIRFDGNFASAAAAIQFRRFINEQDGMHNMAVCATSNSIALFDYDECRPGMLRSNLSTDIFDHMTRTPIASLEYIRATTMNAARRRIATIKPAAYRKLVARVRDVGLPLKPDFARSLLLRRHLFQLPSR